MSISIEELNALCSVLAEEDSKQRLNAYIDSLVVESEELNALEQEKQYEMMSLDADAAYAYIENHM
jgi:hypothetical protein